ncbi:MAG: pitrilysin family protein [Xanthobacteraceae bacterium]
MNACRRRAARRWGVQGALLLAAAIVSIWASPVRAMPIERVVSPLGIEVWLVRQTTVPLINLQFAFAGGAAQDSADKSGVAHLASALLDEGAGKLDSKTFQERLESNAIELRFQAGRDYLQGTLRTLTENRDEAVELLRLALNEPRFDREPVERVRSQVLSSLRRQTTNPNTIGSQRWWETAFPDHPYGRNVDGTVQSVPRITVDDLQAYTKRVLARDNLKIAMVGDIDAAGAAAMVDRIFGALPAKADLRPVPAADPQGLGQRIVVDLDVPQAVVTFGRLGIARKDPDFMAAYIVNYILGGGSFSSRLYREVREKRGLAYGIHDSLVWLKSSSLMLGGTATRSDRTAETLEVIEKETKRLAEEGPTLEELRKAKAYLKGSFVVNLNNSGKIASTLLQIQIDDLGIDYMDRRNALIDAVSLDDAKRVAKRLLDSKMLVTVVGRPEGVTSRN